jgi:OmcA/MtrC family decaheme c-type cytochrome
MKLKLVRFGTAALAAMTIALAGCGGSDGSQGPAGSEGPAGPAGPPGSSATATVSAAALTADQWMALTPKVDPASISVDMSKGTPIVKFTVTDADGTPVVGLGGQKKAATALVPTNYNMAFTLAKLVPGTNGSPSKWVTYLINSPGTVAAPATVANFPQSDSQGTLLDNGDGSYQYTFWRDITKSKAFVDALVDAPLKPKAALGDTTYDPSLTHRLGIIINGAQPGTGTNTPNAVQVVPQVLLVKNFNLGYDFVPAGGAAKFTRDIVVKDSCSECHDGKGIGHAGTKINGWQVGRNDPRLCLTCHTDQIRYTFDQEASSTNGGMTLTGTTRQTQAVIDGRAVGNFPNLIHKMHMGDRLSKQGYNFNADAAGLFNEKLYPQNQGNCTKCHDGSANAKHKTADGDNWKKVPSALACGACHDGINFATGKGTAIGANGQVAGGHVGGAQSSDALCALCHDAASIPVYHASNNLTPHNVAVPAGLKNFKYEIKSVDATATTVKVVFRISADGTPVTFLAPAAAMANPLTGFTGSPGFLLANAQAQDGVTVPADFNNLNGSGNGEAVSVSIANLLDTNKALTSGTLAGPDASGYYTATIVGANVFPAGATMRTVALQGTFSQITAPGTATAPIARQTLSVVQTATGDTPRRSVIDSNKCGNCHEWFIGHGGSRIIGLGSSGTSVCVLCHNPAKKTSGRGIADASLLAYPFTASDNAILADWGFDKTQPSAALAFPQTSNNLKDMIHGIHAADDRTNPFRDVRDRLPSAITLINGSEIGFPGVLKDCQLCHIAGTYSGVPANTLVSTQEADNGVFLNGTSRTSADAKAALAKPNPLDKVTTPFAAACVSCHDGAAAKAHIASNGGQILVVRSSQNAAGEACAVCHGAGAEFDPVKVHQR